MNKYEQLINQWTEAMSAKLEIHKDQAEKATRADYHKGLADGMVTGLSYAMATFATMERRLPTDLQVPNVVAPVEAPVALLKAEAPEARKEPATKRVVAWKCHKCGDEVITYTDPTKPVVCHKCEAVHKFDELHFASYFCECGKICKFMIEEKVEKVKCHCCEKHHRMAKSTDTGRFYSLDSVNPKNYTPKSRLTTNQMEKTKTIKPRPTKFKSKPSRPMFHANTCLECGEEFMTDIENCVTCDNCAGGKN